LNLYLALLSIHLRLTTSRIEGDVDVDVDVDVDGIESDRISIDQAHFLRT